MSYSGLTCDLYRRKKKTTLTPKIFAYVGWNKEERAPELERQLELVGVTQLITQQ